MGPGCHYSRWAATNHHLERTSSDWTATRLSVRRRPCFFSLSSDTPSIWTIYRRTTCQVHPKTLDSPSCVSSVLFLQDNTLYSGRSDGSQKRRSDLWVAWSLYGRRQLLTRPVVWFVFPFLFLFIQCQCTSPELSSYSCVNTRNFCL